jgi:hypothetical protein
VLPCETATPREMRGGGRGQSRGAEVVLGAVRRTEPGHGGHREMVTSVGALEGLGLARLFWGCNIVPSTY